MLGVVAIGNATLIAVEDTPILATDPWFGEEDEAYFGSWSLSHAIPKRERDLIHKAEYHWYSHGHPDHLNPHSIERFPKAKILVPDHIGNRIKRDLEQRGRDVRVLPERTWVQLSKRIRIMSISDYQQDATLLIEVNGRLFVNMNDAKMMGCRRFIRRMAKGYKNSYLLKLAGYGDADMINIFDEEGRRIRPLDVQKPIVGQKLSRIARHLNCNSVIPFSSFHRYQRTDSAWAEAFTTPVEAHREGFDHRNLEYIPPFVQVDAVNGDFVELHPEPIAKTELRPPEAFGDTWSDQLEADDRKLIDAYFLRKEPLTKWYGFLNFKVGGATHALPLSGPRNKGITFEVPRNSLIQAVQYEIFDDLLIGNFMKTTFHNVTSLYHPPFSVYVPRLADNAGAQSEKDVACYMKEYSARSGGEWLLAMFEERAKNSFRRYVSKGSLAFRLGRKIYNAYSPRWY